jgi:hypothetical protein
MAVPIQSGIEESFFQTSIMELGPKRVELKKDVFDFLKNNPETEEAFSAMQGNLKSLFDYIEVGAV